ncbi:50S ribosomal protein L32 [Treponema primitia]|uniref:50S ribosomal protein L32 n=1 Tax=Treponema primitia TaxID=88058 RepID=UPI000304FD7C|nr:50S ribosomal protein L32 [Treponema primitia]
MAVPRANTSKARTRRRQSINMKLTAPTLIECSTCGNRVLPHRVCPKCGFYRGKQVIIPESKV